MQARDEKRNTISRKKLNNSEYCYFSLNKHINFKIFKKYLPAYLNMIYRHNVHMPPDNSFPSQQDKGK